MRLQYLAKEERDVVGQEQSELSAIKQELARLGQLTESPQGRDKPRTHTATHKNQSQSVGLGEAQMEVARLSRERQSLLNARIYSPDDPVIRQLDAKIAQLMLAMNP